MDNVSMGMMMGSDLRPYACQVCNKRFTQKAHLITHKRTHTGEKPYACHICHKRFAQSSHLNTHKRIHTGEKPYFCTICNIGYCRKQRLELHLLHQHSAESVASANITIPDDLEAQSQENPTLNLLDLPDSNIVFPNNVPMSSNNNTPTNMYRTSPIDSTVSGSFTPRRRKPSVVNRIDMGEGEQADNLQDRIKSELINGNDYLVAESSNTSEVGEGLFPNDPVDTSYIAGSTICSANKGPRMSTGKDSEVTEPCGVSTTDMNNSGSGDDIEGDRASVTSESNLSGSEQSLPTKRSMLSYAAVSRSSKVSKRHHRQHNNSGSRNHLPGYSQQIGTNSRICLVNFTSDDLITHLMSRDDVYRCDFCCVIFQDAAMYHLHRSMHEKMDIRCCNLCGKLAQDKYDFLAHFLSEHK